MEEVCLDFSGWNEMDVREEYIAPLCCIRMN